MNKKVIITVEKGRYDPSVKGGCKYTSVGFSASSYGMGSPCDTPEEVESAIRHAKEWIRKEGDIPVVDNTVEKVSLNRWIQ